MSSIPHLIESTFDDMKLLASQYAQLTAIKAKKSSRQGLIGMGMAGSALILFIIATAELIFSLAAVIVGIDQLALTSIIASGITIIIALVLAGIGRLAFKKIDLDPRVSSPAQSSDLAVDFKPFKPRGI